MTADTIIADTAELISRADKGDAAAMYALGIAYYKGSGVKADTDKAVDCLKKSAERGFIESMTVLGDVYGDKRCDKYDNSLAEKYYLQAAASGEYCAINELAALYAAETELKPNAELVKKLDILIEYAKNADAVNVAAELAKLKTKLRNKLIF